MSAHSTENIDLIRSNVGLFFSMGGRYKNRSEGIIYNYKINGKTPEPTYNSEWVRVDGEDGIEKVEKRISGLYINPRWELKDPTLVSEKIPSTLSQDDVQVDSDGVWQNYIAIQSMYDFKRDQLPDTWEEVPFEISIDQTVDIENYMKPCSMSYKLRPLRNAENNDVETDLKNIVSYTQLEKALTPEFLLHMRPCFLPSETFYSIIRRWVQENIDPKVAVITSDYDFCFTVKKKVQVQPWKKQVYKDNGQSYRPPRFSTITEEKVEVFEITPANKGYNNYTVLQPIKGENWQDLVDNVRQYLDDLMAFINVPVSRCSECAGCGHVFPKGFEINKLVKE